MIIKACYFGLFPVAPNFMAPIPRAPTRMAPNECSPDSQGPESHGFEFPRPDTYENAHYPESRKMN